MSTWSGSPKSAGFILWGPWLSVHHFMAVHPVVVEIFQSGPKHRTGTFTLSLNTIPFQTPQIKIYRLCAVCKRKHMICWFLPTHRHPALYILLWVSQDRNRIGCSSTGLTQILQAIKEQRDGWKVCVCDCNMTASKEAKSWLSEYQFSNYNRKKYLTFVSVSAVGSLLTKAGLQVCHIFSGQANTFT